MAVDLSLFRQVGPGSLERYRIGGGTQLVIQENFAMPVRSGFLLSGVLVLHGILIVGAV
jgi:hypothetical protein